MLSGLAALASLAAPAGGLLIAPPPRRGRAADADRSPQVVTPEQRAAVVSHNAEVEARRRAKLERRRSRR